MKRLAKGLFPAVYWILAGLLLVSAAPEAYSHLLANRAWLMSMKAIENRIGWQEAETAWLDAFTPTHASFGGRDGLGQLYYHRLKFDPESAGTSAATLARWANGHPERNRVLFQVGDTLRGNGLLAPAVLFYSAVLPSERPAEVERKLELAQSHGAGNFLDGPHSGPISLGIGNSRWEINVPLIGASLYRLTFEARNESKEAILRVTLDPIDRAYRRVPWTFIREISVKGDWTTFDEYVWFPWYGSPALRLSVENISSHSVVVRNVRFEKADSPENRLVNASFDFYDLVPLSEGGGFAPWSPATFWNDQQSQGWRKPIAGNHSSGALELGLTSAPDAGFHIGMQQDCGELAPGTLLELAADFQLPQDLQGVYAEVVAVIYQMDNPQNVAFLSLRREQTTAGWQRLVVAGAVPGQPGRYGCMVVVHLVAQKPITNVRNVVQIDNVALLSLTE